MNKPKKCPRCGTPYIDIEMVHNLDGVKQYYCKCHNYCILILKLANTQDEAVKIWNDYVNRFGGEK